MRVPCSPRFGASTTCPLFSWIFECLEGGAGTTPKRHPLGLHRVQGGQKMLGAQQEAPEPLWFLKGENPGTSHAVGHLLSKKHKVAHVSEAVGTRGRRAVSAGTSTGAASMEQRGGCPESYRRNHRRPRQPRSWPCPWEN